MHSLFITETVCTIMIVRAADSAPDVHRTIAPKLTAPMTCPPKLVQLFWDYRVDGVGEDLLAL